MAFIDRVIQYPNGPKLFFQKLSLRYWDDWKAYHEDTGEWPVGTLFNVPPFPGDDAEAYLCVEGDVVVNVEYWGVRQHDCTTTTARLTAEAGLLNKGHVNIILDNLASYISRPEGAGASAAALAPDSFTWIGSWDWTTDESDPGHWGMRKLDEILQTCPRGLCAADGTLIAPGTTACQVALLDGPRRMAYMAYDYMGMTSNALEGEFVKDCGRVPLTDVSGMKALKTSTEVYAAGISPDGRSLAIIQYSNTIEFGRGYVSVIDVSSGAERKLAWFTHASGGEQISFSPDGRWILVPRGSRDAGALIIDAASGAGKSFNELNMATCWWVVDGHLGLLCFGHGSSTDADFDPYDVTFFDLTTGQQSAVVRIVPPSFTLAPSYRSYWRAEPRADGRVLLAMDVPPLPGVPYQAHIVIGMLNLHTGVVTQLVQPYADPDGYILRKPKSWHWNAPLDMRVTAEPALLTDGLSRADMTAWPAFDDQYGAVIQVGFDSPFFTGKI